MNCGVDWVDRQPCRLLLVSPDHTKFEDKIWKQKNLSVHSLQKIVVWIGCGAMQPAIWDQPCLMQLPEGSAACTSGAESILYTYIGIQMYGKFNAA